MVEPGKNVDFTVDGHQLALSCQKLLLVGLECYLVACLGVRGFLDGGEASFADDNAFIEVCIQVEDWVLTCPLEIFHYLQELLSGPRLVRYLDNNLLFLFLLLLLLLLGSLGGFFLLLGS